MLYPYLIDISKYFIAGLLVSTVIFIVLKPRLDLLGKIQLLEFRKSLNAQSLPLRLQAYERLVLFIDRINPEQMLLRLSSAGLSARDLHQMALSEIRNEFQHNVTQQIYVSTRAWSTVKKVKEDTVNLMNSAIIDLPESASGLDLARLILTHLSKLENSPYEISSALLKKDLEDIF